MGQGMDMTREKTVKEGMVLSDCRTSPWMGLGSVCWWLEREMIAG